MENYCNDQACSHIKIICRYITVPSGKIRHTFIFHSPSSIFNYYPTDAKTTRENLGWFRLSRNYSFADKQERTVGRSEVVQKFPYGNFFPLKV